MTFGSEIFNDKGFRVFDGQRSMYLKSQGLCTKIPGGSDVYRFWEMHPEGGTNSINKPVSRLWDIVGSSRTQYPANINQFVGSARAYNSGGLTVYSSDGLLGFEDMAFIQIPSEGILQIGLMYTRLSGFVEAGTLQVSSQAVAQIPYMIFGPDIPPSSEQYGMQIWNEAAQLTFDSRNRILGFESFEISAATMQNILINNAVVDLTLSKPMPGAFVTSPHWMSYAAHSTIDGCASWVRITQPNPTTIRLSRTRLGRNTSLNNNASVGYYDATLLVTRGS